MGRGGGIRIEERGEERENRCSSLLRHKTRACGVDVPLLVFQVAPLDGCFERRRASWEERERMTEIEEGWEREEERKIGGKEGAELGRSDIVQNQR